MALLADIRTVFDEVGADRLESVALCAALRGLQDARWSAWGSRRGKPGLQPNDIAFLLRPFGIRPRAIRLNATSERGSTAKGYMADDFEDAWERYLSDTTEDEL